MAEPVHELDRIDPEPASLVLANGLTVNIQRLKTRQFFRLLRILTHGAGPIIMQPGFLQVTDDTTSEMLGQRMLMAVVMAVPDAEQETVEFLQSMTIPQGVVLKADSQLTKKEKESNSELWDKFAEAMSNPEADDTLNIIELVIQQESEDLLALAKKVQKMVEVARKTGQIKTGTPDEPPGPRKLAEMVIDPARSASHSTSSPASTDGQTSESSD